jgi:tRNA dimethylallyltransferase
VTAAVRQTVLVIGGPTAGGKSGLALSVAEERDGAIINADSIQLYDGLGTLTALPGFDDMQSCPHRLYAVLEPDGFSTAQSWREMALAEIDKALQENRLPIVVGGTGFYIKALLEGLSPVPDVPPGIRAALIARQEEIGTAAFFEILRQKDPETAARLDPHNPQRHVRALEVLEATGKPLARWQAAPRAGAPAHLRFVTATLIPPRDALYARCNSRFDRMIDNGALDEVRAFRERIDGGHIPAETPLAKALGYTELAAHLAGEMTLDAAKEAAQTVTRHYAKRQTTWFRNQIRADIMLEENDAKPLLKRL